MFDNIRFFLNFRKQNKIVSEGLGLKRDKKIEIYILFNLWKSDRMVKLLKRNCRCYLDYYSERGKELDFKALDYIAGRIITQYRILKDKEILDGEIENFDNPFCMEYVKQKVEKFIDISDTGTKNLVMEAILWLLPFFLIFRKSKKF